MMNLRKLYFSSSHSKHIAATRDCHLLVSDDGGVSIKEDTHPRKRSV
jgi:hypothetical protein